MDKSAIAAPSGPEPIGNTIPTPGRMRRVIQRIAAKFDHVHFCMAGPTGYGLYRLIRSLGTKAQ